MLSESETERLNKAYSDDDVETVRALLGPQFPVDSGTYSLCEGLISLGANRILQHVVGSGFNPNERRANESPLLVVACMRNNSGAAGVLLAAGAEPNQSFAAGDGDRWTPLLAAAGNNQPEVVKALLEAGADPNFMSAKGVCAAHAAAAHQNVEMLQCLLAAGCRVFGKALALAVAQPNVAMVRVLIAGGADVNATARFGRNDSPIYAPLLDGLTPLAITLDRRYLSDDWPKYSEKCAAFLEVLRELIRGGADVNKVSGNWSPLDKASVAGDVEARALLLHAGANPSAANYPRRQGQP